MRGDAGTDDPGVRDSRALLAAAGVDVVDIADPADPALSDFADLTDVALRAAREPGDGLFIAEGAKTILRAVEAGYRIRSVLTSDRWLASIAAVISSADHTTSAVVHVAAPELLESVTGYAVHRGALASFARRGLPSVANVAGAATSLVVLEDLTDHTNVGLVFRSAAALGVGGVVLSPRCADPLYRRAIRTSMGAVLALPYARMTNWYTGVADLRASGYRVLALTPDGAAVPLDEALRRRTSDRDRVALVLGSEGDGLTRRWLAEADEQVRIPMAAGIDSLNVAAAAAIACYVLARRGE